MTAFEGYQPQHVSYLIEEISCDDLFDAVSLGEVDLEDVEDEGGKKRKSYDG